MALQQVQGVLNVPAENYSMPWTRCLCCRKDKRPCGQELQCSWEASCLATILLCDPRKASCLLWASASLT
jgi:hypothetical protein